MANRKTIKPEDAKDALDFYRSVFGPKYHQYNLDEVTRYVFKYCQDWMTDDERTSMLYLAFRHSAWCTTNQRDEKYFQNQAKKLWTDKVEVLTKDGEEAFFYLVKDRIIADRGNQPLNLCPKCGTLARTASARQCQKCFHDWHGLD